MVLCIEDEATVLETRKLVLQAAGFSVLTAQSGHDGYEKFLTNRVDAVILDQQARGGEQAAADMKKAKPRVPILMLSNLLPDVMPEVVDAMMTKGENPARLLAKLESLLRPRGTAGGR